MSNVLCIWKAKVAESLLFLQLSHSKSAYPVVTLVKKRKKKKNKKEVKTHCAEDELGDLVVLAHEGPTSPLPRSLHENFQRCKLVLNAVGSRQDFDHISHPWYWWVFTEVMWAHLHRAAHCGQWARCVPKLDGVNQGIIVLWGHTACPAQMRTTICLGLVPRARILCLEERRKSTGTPLNGEHGACLPLRLLICRCRWNRWLFCIPWCKFSHTWWSGLFVAFYCWRVIPLPIAGVL